MKQAEAAGQSVLEVEKAAALAPANLLLAGPECQEILAEHAAAKAKAVASQQPSPKRMRR